jgi:glucosylceramidase
VVQVNWGLGLRTIGVIAVATAVTTGLTTAPGGAVETAQPSAHAWVTTAGGAYRMSDRGDVPFRSGGSKNLTITVDPSRVYQRMDGFGASITDSSAHVLYTLQDKARDSAMRDLFSPAQGNGLSVLRQPMGASDFVAGGFYTYDDMAPGQTDYGMRHFSIAHDQPQILPLLRQALRLNPKLKVVATPWSPPAWMKTDKSLIGGRLIDDPRIYRAYASYFVKYLQAYQRAGVAIYAVAVQNEPQNRNPRGYPGMDLPVAQQAKLVNALGPALRAAGLNTKILGYDHNWSEHPDDVATTPPGEDPEAEYPADLLASTAGRWLAGTAFHCYSGDQARQTALHQAFPAKGVWFTECSGSHEPSDLPGKVFSDTLKWHARNLVLGVTRNWGKTVVNWNLALDPSGGPHNGGCGTCTGVVTVGPGQMVTRNAEYYTLGHLARFVKPGAVRVASTSFGTTGWNGQIMDAAFRNPDGSTALVVHNENDAPRTFAVAQGGHSFDYTLPGGALATFTWPRSAALGDGLHLLDHRGMTATSPAAPTDTAKAIDDDATTRWTTGSSQQPGQHLSLDLGRANTVRRLVLDSGTDVADFPVGYQISTSADGVEWSRPVASGRGQGQLTVIDLPATRSRYLRVTQTSTSAQWWTVADLRVYG